MNLSTGTKLYLYGFVPAIMEFAGWVLEEAVRSGRKRLYFLSRDGYQIYLAACKLAELRKLLVDCRYLHVSRYAMRVPAYHLDMKSCLDRICSGGMEVTLERILKRAALTEEEALEVAQKIGKRDTYRNILNRRQTAELKEILAGEPLFLEYVKTHSKEAYENAMGYLQQEGLLSDISYAIVDSGWVGTFQQSLQLLVQSRRPDIRMTGYYFGLYEIPPSADACDYHGWYFTPQTGLKRKVYFSNSLFEAICGADEGMTVGYLWENGKYLPRLDPEGNPNSEKMRRNLEALERFLERYSDIEKVKPGSFLAEHAGGAKSGSLAGRKKGMACSSMGISNQGLDLQHSKKRKNSIKYRQINKNNSTGDGKKLVYKMFAMLMAMPSVAETESFGEFLFSDDVLTGNCQEIAARLNREEIRNLYILRRLAILNGLKRGSIRESAWVEGSITRCGQCGGQRVQGRQGGIARYGQCDGQRVHGRQGSIDIGEQEMNRCYIREDLRHIRWYKYLVYGRKQLKAWLPIVAGKEIKAG